jgi:hypothetical protein
MMMSFAGEGWGEGMEKSVLKQRPRNLRQNSTDAERHLWYYLRANRLGCKFKRQVPMGAYIVDFACEVHSGRFIVSRSNSSKALNFLKKLLNNVSFFFFIGVAVMCG